MTPAPESTVSGTVENTILLDSQVSADGSTVTLTFRDAIFTFHAQWLHDAECEHGFSKTAANAFCQQPSEVRVKEANIAGSGIKTVLEVIWDKQGRSQFPAAWLRVLAPAVAKNSKQKSLEATHQLQGWLAQNFVIPEIPYESFASDNISDEEFLAAKTYIFDTILGDSSPGLIKITNLPPVDPQLESTQRDNLVTRILKRLFGSVFQHQRRGPDETFKIASQYDDNASQAAALPAYNMDEILLPHTDHAHYESPIRVQGFHAIEGTTENTFVHAFAVLATLLEEDKDSFMALCESPMIVGRVAPFYSPPFAQAAVDTAVRRMAGFPQQIQRVRWHPHSTGYLLSSFDEFEKARKAHCKFQEIIRRPSHQHTIRLQPGDLYLWDNFKVLHGREKILNVPRLAIGQTVIEQVVSDEHRAIRMNAIREFIDDSWLVQTPNAQLDDLVKLIEASISTLR